MTVKVTDPALLEGFADMKGMIYTQGFLNYRRVSASTCTHVLVSDPTRGYGVTIGAMLEEERAA